MAFQILISMCASVCNSTQARVIWEKGASVKKMPPEDWPVDKPVAFSWLMIEMGGHSSLWEELLLLCGPEFYKKLDWASQEQERQ